MGTVERFFFCLINRKMIEILATNRNLSLPYRRRQVQSVKDNVLRLQAKRLAANRQTNQSLYN